jgi:tripartite-type tricarboxylate transporter receptor subunit TctC
MAVTLPLFACYVTFASISARDIMASMFGKESVRSYECLPALAVISCTMAFLAVGLTAAGAQSFPTKPIRIIVGPSPDAVARVMGQYLQDRGQPVVIEARTGAGGQIAATTVANAEPDGHTLLFATPTYTLNTALKTAPYDVLKDFEPAALIGTGAYTLVVHPSLPVKSVADLIALAKSQPGKLNCASAGIGTAPQIACETFNKMPGVNVVHVPYRNVNEAMNGIVGGHVQMFVSVSLVAKQQMASGTVRALATTGPQRSQILPELPTLVESGYPNFVLSGWNGLLAPAATPKPILDKLNAEVRRGIEQPQVRERLVQLGQEIQLRDRPGFRSFVEADLARWTVLVEAIGRDKLTAAPGPDSR